jgi:hypothetical protein
MRSAISAPVICEIYSCGPATQEAAYTCRRNFYDATTMCFRNLRLVLVSVVGLMSSSCLAQIDLAGLSGTVGDSAGRRLPGAHIVAVQLATGLHRVAVSSATGVYDIPDLPIGLYRVTCSAPGFQDRVYDGLQQTVGHTSTLDISLGVAGVAQTVTVEQTESEFDRTSDALGARTEQQQF